MMLTEEELILLRDAIYQTFENPDKLEEILNKDENFKGKLVLKIDEKNLPDDDYLDTLNNYNNSNNEKIQLLVLEAYSHRKIESEREHKGIVYELNDKDYIKHNKISDFLLSKQYGEFQETIANKQYSICHIRSI